MCREKDTKRRMPGARGNIGEGDIESHKKANKTEKPTCIGRVWCEGEWERRHDFAGSRVNPPVRDIPGNKNRFPMAMGNKKSHCWLLSGS